MFELTQEGLKSLLSYNEETGLFTNLITRGSRAIKGSIAGSVHSGGYIRIWLFGKAYFAHRLAWLYTYGFIPDSDIDHKDRDPANNKISNLRLATSVQNASNRIQKDTSFYRGVSQNGNNFKSKIFIAGKTKELGTYATPEEASIVYEQEAKKLQGEFYVDPGYSYCKEIKPKKLGRKISATGYIGVYKRGEKFRAIITKDGKSTSLGTFATAEEASKAYEEAKNG